MEAHLNEFALPKMESFTGLLYEIILNLTFFLITIRETQLPHDTHDFIRVFLVQAAKTPGQTSG